MKLNTCEFRMAMSSLNLMLVMVKFVVKGMSTGAGVGLRVGRTAGEEGWNKTINTSSFKVCVKYTN